MRIGYGRLIGGAYLGAFIDGAFEWPPPVACSLLRARYGPPDCSAAEKRPDRLLAGLAVMVTRALKIGDIAARDPIVPGRATQRFRGFTATGSEQLVDLLTQARRESGNAVGSLDSFDSFDSFLDRPGRVVIAGQRRNLDVMDQPALQGRIEIAHVCLLRSMTRPGASGPTPFILTMTFLPAPSTRAYLSFPSWRTPPNFSPKSIWMASDHAAVS
jgi:hypothetical protein